MQFAKDSFYMALRERLAALNPSRTVTLNGSIRPAVIVSENELPGSAARVPDAFYLDWGKAEIVAKHTGDRALARLDCRISYFTVGSCESAVDRGRKLAALDDELFEICLPPSATKRDFAQVPSVDLGTKVFWTLPVWDTEKVRINSYEVASTPAAGSGAGMRSALVTLLLFPEVNLS